MSRMLWVYILTNKSGGLYVGVTNDLRRRCFEHALGIPGAFTAKYRMTRLVHVEAYADFRGAMRREKQLKGWTRRKKIALIERTNREWRDLLDP